jgi:hypothetical protein
MLFITEIIGSLCQVKNEVEFITIETLFHNKDSLGHYLNHDWQDQDDFVNAYEVWIEHKTKKKPQFICHTQRSDIAHRRKLTLEFDSGEKLIIKFDQGVGYWKLNESGSKYPMVKFNFGSDLQYQLGTLQSLEGSLLVKNSEDWSTDITYLQG